jgi:hypothetical protein
MSQDNRAASLLFVLVALAMTGCLIQYYADSWSQWLVIGPAMAVNIRVAAATGRRR